MADQIGVIGGDNDGAYKRRRGDWGMMIKHLREDIGRVGDNDVPRKTR